MAMGIRDGEQAPLWVVTSDLPKSPGHPFFARLNALLDANDFDRFVEKKCQSFYAKVMGRPSLTPGRYFRLLNARLLRGDRLGTRHRVACDGLAGDPQFSGLRRARRPARSFDDFSDPAPD